MKKFILTLCGIGMVINTLMLFNSPHNPFDDLITFLSCVGGILLCNLPYILISLVSHKTDKSLIFFSILSLLVFLLSCWGCLSTVFGQQDEFRGINFLASVVYNNIIVFLSLTLMVIVRLCLKRKPQ